MSWSSKPSEKTPAVAEMLVQCFHAAGVDEGAVQLLIGAGEQGQALVAHRGVDGVLFTGSVQTGIAINRKLATSPGKIVALEMGGNNPLIVADTPKLADAATLIVQSAFTTSGQRCTAARRLIVIDSMYDAIMAEVKALTKRIIVDEPFADPAPFMGPVIDNRAAEQLNDSFVYLLSHGGKPIVPMRRPGDDLPLSDTRHHRHDRDEGTARCRAVRPAAAGHPRARSRRRHRGGEQYALRPCRLARRRQPEGLREVLGRIRAGIVNWNRPTSGASSAAPFGGIGLSGNHRPAAYYAADYCAYPVASTEMEQPRASIGLGLS